LGINPNATVARGLVPRFFLTPRNKEEGKEVWQKHDVTRAGEFERLMNNGVFDELKKAQKMGKVKFIGISTHAKPKEILSSLEYLKNTHFNIQL